MLSVCIPVYNCNITPLIASLHLQALLLDVPIELLIVDDASDSSFAENNRPLASLPLVKYIELPQNAGRSRIRNLMTSMASYPWLLFMDCDSLPPDNQFLQRYLDARAERSVVCGGRSYLPKSPMDQTHLHWWYGSHREVHPAVSRNLQPYHSFMTNNFMVLKSIMVKIPFSETINGYGHEDTLFGYELRKHSIPVLHIDNPLLHTGLQTDKEFLEKTHQGISNLWRIHTTLGKPLDFVAMVRVLRTYNQLERLGLSRTFCLLTNPLLNFMQKNLASKKPNLYYLDIYKLRLLCLESQKVKN